MRRTGPVPNREGYDVIGKYLHDALTLAGKTQADLANLAETSPGNVAKVMAGQRPVNRKTLLHWCGILETPEWLVELILNAAGFASDRQQQAASDQDVVERTHLAVLDEVAKRKLQ